MSNSIESTSKQNSDRNFLVAAEAFIFYFIDNAFVIDNASLNKKEVFSTRSKIWKGKNATDNMEIEENMENLTRN